MAANKEQDKYQTEVKRKAAHVNAIEDIKEAADNCITTGQCEAELARIEAIRPDAFEEFAGKASHAIANAAIALNEKNRQLVIENEQAEKERIYDEAIIENGRREHEAEVARQQEAIKPDIEKVQAWLTRLAKVKQPTELESDKATSLVQRYADFMADFKTEVDSMSEQDEAA